MNEILQQENISQKDNHSYLRLSAEESVDKLEINIRDKNGCTPLHWAVFASSTICTSYLLAREGIEINAQDTWGRTPLHTAIRKGEYKLIK